MSGTPGHSPLPRLRLVGTPTIYATSAERDVAAENASAALGADDARQAFAVAVARSLEGGRAAILRPDARRSLTSQAGRLGLRPFDAALVIAIVQDAARRGESPDSPPMLAAIPTPSQETPSPWAGVVGALLAAGLVALVVWWLLAA